MAVGQIGSNKFEMRNQNPFSDKFSQYLSRKLGSDRAEDIVFGSQKPHQSANTHLLSPHRNSQPYYENSPCQLSINSSNFSSSNSHHLSRQSNPSFRKASTNRKLRKVKDIEENVCSICLDAIKE